MQTGAPGGALRGSGVHTAKLGACYGRSYALRHLKRGWTRSSPSSRVPEFQSSSGYDVKTTFERINIITERVRKGDDVDLAIVSLQQWEGLQQEGKLDPRVRVVIAKVGFGVFVKKGAAKPDVSSVEAFKRAFLNARSIASFNPSTRGPTAIYQDRLFERLDLTVDLNSSIKYAAAPKPNQVIRPRERLESAQMRQGREFGPETGSLETAPSAGRSRTGEPPSACRALGRVLWGGAAAPNLTVADDPRGCIQDAGTGTGRALGGNPPPAVRAGTGARNSSSEALAGAEAQAVTVSPRIM
jgi:hypothetical protein